MTKIDITFEGTLTNTTPIHITPPNSPAVPVGKGTANEIAMMPLMKGGELVRLPIIPASTIRGKLRRAAVGVCLPYLREKPSLEGWLYATLGGAKGSETEDVFSVVERTERRAANPVIGLFGAGAPWDSSRAYVGDAIPTIRVQPETITSVRSDDFVNRSDINDILDPDAVPDYLRRREGSKAKSAASQKRDQAFTDWRKAFKAGDTKTAAMLKERIQELESKDGPLKQSENPIQLPLGHRILPANVPMAHSMTLKGVTEIEAGLFIAAIDHMFWNEPMFGGMTRLEYGKVDAEWEVKIREDGKWTSLGRINGKTFSPLQHSSARIAALLTAWEAFAKSDQLSLEVNRKPSRKAAVNA